MHSLVTIANENQGVIAVVALLVSIPLAFAAKTYVTKVRGQRIDYKRLEAGRDIINGGKHIHVALQDKDHPSERDIAREIMVYMEDKRIFYTQDLFRNPEHAIESILQMREVLTGAIYKTDNYSQLDDDLRAMRAACRDFLQSTHNLKYVKHTYLTLANEKERKQFVAAMQAMRAVFLPRLSSITTRYNLKVEEDLQRLFARHA
jgi:hypothetical protein